MEVSAGATENPYRITCPDPQDGAGESGVGREERIANELLVKLGIQVSPRTVRK